jgi:hypothetical protein
MKRKHKNYRQPVSIKIVDLVLLLTNALSKVALIGKVVLEIIKLFI